MVVRGAGDLIPVKSACAGWPMMEAIQGGSMYKHILVPTDGSELSAKAVKAAMQFARESGARVTAFTAVPEYRIPDESEIMSRRAESPVQYERRAKAQALKTLRPVAARARAAGVSCDEDFAFNDRPYEAIIGAARKHGCDLIFMASHGRRGLSALIHGSQTRDVLTHSTIPTLVYR
jgi:nucleotide-binding universal stress UspA family protein